MTDHQWWASALQGASVFGATVAVLSGGASWWFSNKVQNGKDAKIDSLLRQGERSALALADLRAGNTELQRNNAELQRNNAELQRNNAELLKKLELYAQKVADVEDQSLPGLRLLKREDSDTEAKGWLTVMRFGSTVPRPIENLQIAVRFERPYDTMSHRVDYTGGTMITGDFEVLEGASSSRTLRFRGELLDANNYLIFEFRSAESLGGHQIELQPKPRRE